MAKKTRDLCEEIKAEKYKIKLKVNYIGSIFSIFFTDNEVIDYRGAKSQDIDLFKRFYHGLLKEGIYFSPSGFESNFISIAHTAEDIDKTLQIISRALKKLSEA